ncbi:ABC transporter ATP-binding protein [Dactylosporangium sp. NPDC051485]|uniref:ABC transporter ATP-binding protein n=1 Tax=Dactylosporangium sp. NPDC051485 TaxID=3154846 RepID=UPI00341BD088
MTDGKLSSTEPHADDPLVVRGLTVRYGGVVAVDDFDLVLQANRVHALIGPNGAGKSSVVDAVSGFVKPAGGRISLNGRNLAGIAPHRRAGLGLARSFQHLELFDDLTVGENIAASRRSGERDSSSWRSSAEMFGLGDLIDRKVSDLAHGQRRLVSVARAMATDPSVVILDEPGSGLDGVEKRQLGQRICEMAERGVAVLLVDHDMSFVFDVSNDVTVLNFGRVLATGGPDAIRKDPRVRKAYLG